MINLPTETFLESFPAGAALIGLDKRIVRLNSRLSSVIDSGVGRLCYEALAGSAHYCPFCPLDDIIAGTAHPIEAAMHVRWGRSCSVSVRLLDNGLILETVQDMGEADNSKKAEERSDGKPADLRNKRQGLYRIARDLMGRPSFKDQISDILVHLKDSLNRGADTKVWLEADGETFGETGSDDRTRAHAWDVNASGETRGQLFVAYPVSQDFSREDKDFLEEAATLIGLGLQLSDHEERIRQSEERYMKLADNLAQEMWGRTEALAKETGYLEGILRSSDDMIITTDLESRIVEFNHGAEKILGYRAEEMLGHKITDVWENAEEREEILAKVTASGGVRNYDTRLRTKSGELREVSLTLSLLKDSEGRTLGTVGVSKDITREKAFLRQLELLNWNYRETLGFINHESKNSLIVIGGFVRRLLETETDPARIEQLQIVYHHAKFLEAMTKDFLVMAELEHGEFRIRKEMINDFYKEVILPAMVGLKERYPDSFETYDTSLGGVGAIQLVGDAGLLEIVYRNLFGNALKYRYPGGKIAYGVAEQPNAYLLNVWNEGPGVQLDQIEKIFGKFYRTDDETTRKKRGTGLGLYNIRRIIEAHGGRIWCETSPGYWINFLFVLPKECEPSEAA